MNMHVDAYGAYEHDDPEDMAREYDRMMQVRARDAWYASRED